MKVRMILIAVLTVLMIAPTFAQMGRGGSDNPGGWQRGGHDVLTEEQKQELQDLVSTMRDAGATREEIKQAVDALFEEWGIDRPERDGNGKKGDKKGGKDKGGKDKWGDLTDEQRAELKELVQQMKDDGATREEIQSAVEALFAEWGLEMPDHPGKWGKKGRKGFGDPQLTDEQREILHTKIKELKDADATREEIKAAVEALYAEWGLDMPERKNRWDDLLTEEQQEELKAMVQEMRDQGATRSEIKEAVNALFEEWGLELPEFRKGRKGKHGKGKPWMKDLTEEQRTIILDLIKAMREDGATREEIRDAVKKQLEEWGIGVDDDPEGTQLQEDRNLKAKNAPNPFNPTTTITYSLQDPGQVSVKVYNTQGQLIRTLVDAYANEGSHSVVWDGLNEKGEMVSSGMYFYKVTSANETITERMMLMK